MRKSPVHGSTGEPEARSVVRESQTVPAGDQEVSAPHPRVPDIVPAAWVDRLLLASLDLPLEGGERAVVVAMVDALAAILPGHAAGACFVPAPGAELSERLVVRRLPEGLVETPAGIDPTRVFPYLAHEHVAPVAGSTTGSTLHVASDVDGLDRDVSPAVHLVERAAMALGRALVHARQIATLVDVRRDVRAIEDRLIQADKLATFGQIAAGVVHELNNPLTSIVAYSDFLIRKALASEASQGRDEDDVERLRRISESANRMLRFTRDLMSYARPSSAVVGPVVLHAAIDQAVAFCEHILAGAKMTVERRYGPDVLMVRGVSEQLVQVFVNLLTNASQAAAAGGGTVVLITAVDATARRIRVEIRDDGTGIPPENLSQVFAPFFTTKSERHGTGLGLSIVRSIVLSHDGDIRAESQPGSGAMFVLELPAWQRG
jgi:two-component system NtrC family sensor kinase